MPYRAKLRGIISTCGCLLVSFLFLTFIAVAQDSKPEETANSDPLVRILAARGLISAEDVKALAAAPSTVPRDRLVALLAQKGLLTPAEVASLANYPAAPDPKLVPAVATAAIPAPSIPATAPQAPPATQAVPAAVPPPVAALPAPAVLPLRVLPVTPPVKGGLVPAFQIGPVSVTPYGFIKATAAHDSSMPNGDDFPFPGLFLTSTSVLNTGPTKDPEFHLKARSSRVGLNLEWPDISKKVVLTGRLEGDFEGNFSEVDNRDVSSIRSNAFQLRLAYARIDYNASDKTDFFFQGGQDWSIFGSSALPNLLETTFLGAFWGDIYQRSPQMRFGLVQKLGGSRNFTFSPEVAMMMPSTGQIEKLGSLITCPPVVAPATVATCSFINGLANQLGQAERQGADYAQPELEARAVLQFQLDTAPAVPPAQLIVSGFQSHRRSIVTSDAYPVNASLGSPLPANYIAAFPNGFQDSSKQWGGQIAAQLPTRWATLSVSAYRGADLRFFFGGQIESYFTDTAGLTNTHTVFQTVDNVAGTASGAMILGTNASGAVVVAPQRPVRAFGGFVNLGLPLSRWFNANPKGHNAGWQLYLHAGKDQVLHKDALHALSTGGLPLYLGSMAAVTLYYKLNPWVTFGFEQSMYADHIIPELGGLYTIAGTPSRTWIDHRSEFGPIFTF
jgi:hypothetical protein